MTSGTNTQILTTRIVKHRGLPENVMTSGTTRECNDIGDYQRM
jgi:hypothetical protein